MSTPTQKSEYMLLFRGSDWHKGLSPEEIQTVMSQWKNWFERLTSSGKAKAGHPLEPEGKIVSGKKGRQVADGPFAESKEAIGGYFFLEEEVAANGFLGFGKGAIGHLAPLFSRNDFAFRFEWMPGLGFARARQTFEPVLPLAHHGLNFFRREAFVPVPASKQQHVFGFRCLCAHILPFFSIVECFARSIIQRMSNPAQDIYFCAFPSLTSICRQHVDASSRPIANARVFQAGAAV